MSNAQKKSIELASYLDRLFPILRSITGNGVRETFLILSEIIPYDVLEFPSGTKVFDWEIPPEWNVEKAQIKDDLGNVLVDVDDHPLHILNYSIPFSGTVSLNELQDHLYSLPERPEAIPYVSSYYKERWGMCVSEQQRQALKPGNYRVDIQTSLDPNGSLSIAEYVIPGRSKKEILFTAYSCHPGMGNDEMGGMIALTLLADRLLKKKNFYTYRFLLHPETIGSISYLAHRGKELKQNLHAGHVIANICWEQPFNAKRSRCGGKVDQILEYVLKHERYEQGVLNDFSPLASDERQYCSPGFNLPVCSIWRGDPYFQEYHSSLDSKEKISTDAIWETVDFFEEICSSHEMNLTYQNLFPDCEPQLGKRGLYPTIGASSRRTQELEALLWVLNLSDGNHDLLQIAKKSATSLKIISEAAQKCEQAGLLVSICK
ncbi:DUF4910 domain-containing protein [Terasakiella sp. SH-1]|uniref:DUF4910 domain-containing protein n=1 Tax=Terasakiella sp. SH-1 TaxID=2560057 RepID=UPI00107433C4|nr:DUF4910 domain-containing protein [Terasakiella sp. SH-1]